MLVTGGAGFVGSHVSDALLESGAKVRALDNFLRGEDSNLAQAKSKGSLSLHSGDIRDSKIWDEVLPGVDVVFHQAALRVVRCQEDPAECWEVMVESVRRMLDACVRHKVKKVVLASSAIVYGKADILPTPESHHLNGNTTWYGAAKILNEQLLNAYRAQHGLAGVALRYFNIYGPRMAVKGHTEVLVKWLEALTQGKKISIFGDGTQSMDWVHVRDVARANVLAAQSSADQGVFNVASGRETTLLDLARLLLKTWGTPGEPELSPQAPINPIPRRWADVSSARKTLGFVPEIFLEQGLAETTAWWKTLCSKASGAASG